MGGSTKVRSIVHGNDNMKKWFNDFSRCTHGKSYMPIMNKSIPREPKPHYSLYKPHPPFSHTLLVPPAFTEGSSSHIFDATKYKTIIQKRRISFSRLHF